MCKIVGRQLLYYINFRPRYSEMLYLWLILWNTDLSSVPASIRIVPSKNEQITENISHFFSVYRTSGCPWGETCDISKIYTAVYALYCSIYAILLQLHVWWNFTNTWLNGECRKSIRSFTYKNFLMYVYTARGTEWGTPRIPKEFWNFKTSHKTYNFTYFKGCSDVTLNIHKQH
jgi:hypothetical protein